VDGPAVSDRIRILLAITRLELGGAQRVVLHTARDLDRELFDVALAWGPGDLLDQEAAQISELTRFPIEFLVRPVAPLSDIRALSSLRKATRSFRPQVIHTHSSKAGILGRIAAHLEGVPAVHTIHGYGFTPLQSTVERIAFRTAERVMSRFTRHFVTVSEIDRQRGIELGLFDEESSQVIRAGIDLAQFANTVDRDVVRRKLGVPADARLVTQVGNFKPQKAPLDFVRVAASVHEAHPGTWFVMAGDGPLRGAAESLARELGVAERIVFSGWWDDVAGLLAATDVSVLTSRHEGLPCSVVESLAAGVPVVATAVDGTVEVVRPDDNGYLVPAGDIVALADAVIRLLRDADLRERMGKAARGRLQQFDRDLMVRQQEELYRWVISNNRS
jgi:glycosyltransferase involved in cell wall biosynthesis